MIKSQHKIGRRRSKRFDDEVRPSWTTSLGLLLSGRLFFLGLILKNIYTEMEQNDYARKHFLTL